MSTNSLRNHNIAKNTVANTQTPAPPVITGYAVSGLDDTALDPAGGQTILINGRGFLRGATVTLNGTAIGVVTWVNAGQLSFTSPANTAGTYQIYVVNVDGGTAIYLPGVVYSSFPTWTTTAGTLGSYYETKSISNTVAATGDAPITYSLASGTLPTGATLSSSGVITGTAPADTGSTTYTFTIQADDAQKQSSTRTFSLTINTDVVTWVSPTSGSTVYLDPTPYSQTLNATAATGYSTSYTANTLPTGLTLSSGTISGTPSVEGTTTTLLTATAATSGRSATSTITWVVLLNDAYWKYATLLLTANASSQTRSFASDNSINNSQLTVVGDTKAQNFNPYQFGYYSVYHGTTTNGWQTAASTATSIIGTSTLSSTSTFTFEAWIYPLARHSGGGAVLGYLFGSMNISGAQADWTIGPDSTGKLTVFWYNSGNYLCNSTNVIPLNVWTHVAVCVNVGVITMFINGVKETLTGTTTATTTSGSVLGYLASGGYTSGGTTWQGFNGYISNMRVVKNIVMYPSNFTPSTAPLLPVTGTTLLMGQSNKFIDNSNLNNTLTLTNTPQISSANPFATQYVATVPSYSNYFPYTTAIGPSISVPASAFMMSTNNFTVEGWFYCTNYSNGPVMYDNWGGSPGGSYIPNQWQIWVSTSGVLTFTYCPTNSTSTAIGTGTILVNTWYHFAVVRSSTTVTVYLNGVASGSGTLSITTVGVNYTGSIGRQTAIGAGGDSYSWAGYISNIRSISGQALYTGNFIPPTAQLTTSAVGTSGSNVAASITGTVLLLACQSPTVVDNSSNNLTLTPPNTQVTVSQVNPFTPAYYSNYFNGSSYLVTPTSSLFNYGSGDFTIEAWILTTSSASQRIVGIGSNNYSELLLVNSGSNVWLNWYDGTADRGSSSYNVPQNQWVHVAVSRAIGTIRLFINGVLSNTPVSSPLNFTGTNAVYIGVYGNNTSLQLFNGYISNVRYVVGTALYTAAFTPSTSPLTAVANTQLLTCQSQYFIDNSTNVFTITQNGTPKIAAIAPFTQPTGYSGTQITTYGSGYFDGTGDSLTVTNNGQLVFGTSDFTIEYWWYPGTNTTSNRMFGNLTTGSGYVAGKWAFWPYNASGKWAIDVYNINSAATAMNSTTTMAPNTWYHIALTRSGNVWRLFVNGVQEATITNSASLDSGTASPITVGGSGYSTESFVGYMSDVRMIKGTALYTANFVPQFASPLTSVTNTQLLTLQTNGSHNNSVFNDNSKFNQLITRAGNATNGTFSPYGDNWSWYDAGGIAGTSSYIQFPVSSNYQFGTGDFTIEFWCYVTLQPSGDDFTGWVSVGGVYGQAYNSIEFTMEPSGAFSISSFNNTTNLWYSNLVDSTTKIFNKWHHCAVTRSGTTVYTFFDGTLKNTITGISTNYNSSYLGVQLFARPNSTTTTGGYMSNLRIIKGQALYTGAFTPSTAPLTSTSVGTSGANVAATITGTVSLLTANSNRYVDNSPQQAVATLTGSSIQSIQKFSPFSTVTVSKNYSGYTASTSNYWSVTPLATAFPYSTTTWTIEGWFFFNSFSAQNGLATVGDLFQWYIPSGGASMMFSYRTGTSWTDKSITYSFSTSTWYHVAVVNNASSCMIYINGNSVGTATSYPNTGQNGGTGAAAFWIGVNDVYSFNSADNPLNGLVSNFRICSIAVYTGNFTVPTSTLTTTQSAGTNISAITSGQCKLLTFTSNTVYDVSGNCTVAQVGSPSVVPLTPFTQTTSATTSYSPAVFGGSMYFDGASDYIAVANNPLHGTLGTVNFTLECWFYLNTVTPTNQYIISHRVGAYVPFLFWTNTSTLQYYVSSTNGSWDLVNAQSLGTVAANQWYHLAYTRNGSTFKVFVNGVQAHTFTSSNSFTATTNPLNMGASSSDTNSSFNGYISDVRFTRGVSLYDVNFYPSVTPLTATPTIGSTSYSSVLLINGTSSGVADQTRTVDLETVGDAKVTPFSPYNGTYYSNYFNGSTSYLEFPNSTALQLGSTYTVEMWAFLNSYGTNPRIFCDGVAGVNNIDICITNSDKKLNLSGGAAISSTYTFPLGTWQHIAVVVNAGAVTVYINGSAITMTGTLTGYNNNVTTTRVVGSYSEANYIWTGYISNVRLIKSQALFSGNFTPSTTPLTTTTVGHTGAGAAASITGTVSLLTCQSNKVIDNSSNNATPVSTSVTQIATQNPFQINSGISYYFDGTGDYLSTRITQDVTFSDSQFTIECWLYPMSLPTSGNYKTLWAQRANTGSFGGPAIVMDSSGNYLMFVSNAGITAWDISAGSTGFTASLNQWQHLAFVRSGNNFVLYKNGTAGTTQTKTGAVGTSGNLTIMAGSADGGQPVDGYMTDLRITKGYARTITVPTQPYKLN